MKYVCDTMWTVLLVWEQIWLDRVDTNRKIGYNNVTCGWWDCKKPDENLVPTMSMKGLKYLSTNLWLTEKKENWRERERERQVSSVNMGLLSYGQADRLALHQKRTWKDEIWAISPFAMDEACTNETHPCAPPPAPLSIAFQESSIHPSLCLSFTPVLHVSVYPPQL